MLKILPDGLLPSLLPISVPVNSLWETLSAKCYWHWIAPLPSLQNKLIDWKWNLIVISIFFIVGCYSERSGVMVWGGGAFRVLKVECHEWDQCHYKRDPRKLPHPFHNVRTNKKRVVWERGSGSSPDPKSATAFCLRNWEIKFYSL